MDLKKLQSWLAKIRKLDFYRATLSAAFWFNIDSFMLLGGIFFIAGLYMSVQEALESTVTADMVDHNMLAMSYGALGTVNGSSKFVSSTLVGVLWTVVSPTFGFGLAAFLMTVGTSALFCVRK